MDKPRRPRGFCLLADDALAARRYFGLILSLLASRSPSTPHSTRPSTPQTSFLGGAHPLRTPEKLGR